jgi:DNA-binding PadR family transcriptional regulator
VLCLLEIGPLHPYGIQRLIREWGKDKVVNVGQRANLYRTITRLQEAGLVAVRQTERDQQFPERTVYELTDAGRQASQEWLADMLATARNEFPDFPAALSFLMVLGPERAGDLLAERVDQLRAQLAEHERELAELGDQLPRVALLETEHARAVTAAELAWLVAVVDDLRAGRLTWDKADFDPAAVEAASGTGRSPVG